MKNKLFWRAKSEFSFKLVEAAGDEHLDMDFYDAFYYRTGGNTEFQFIPTLKICLTLGKEKITLLNQISSGTRRF